MITRKSFQLENSEGLLIFPTIIEFVHGTQSIFTWPSSLVLSLYLTSNINIAKGKICLEIGAGTSLPSIVAGLCGAKSVIISDRANEPAIMQNIQDIIALNSLQNVCTSLPLDWGFVEASKIQLIDVLLGADVLYSTEAFDSVLLTFVCYLSRNPEAVFYTTYQERRY